MIQKIVAHTKTAEELIKRRAVFPKTFLPAPFYKEQSRE